VRVHPLVLASAEVVRQRIYGRRHTRPAHKPHEPDCYTSRCACGFSCTWHGEFPSSVRQTAIYTKTDGIVDWKMCVNDNRRDNVEVTGTHCGLAWNPEAYQVIAEKLALRPLRRRRSRAGNGRVSRRALKATA
jgi:hypothetical protein